MPMVSRAGRDLYARGLQERAVSASPIILAGEPPFRLAEVAVDPATCTIRIDDGAHQIEPKVMQVLVALQRRQNEVVSRSELHETCWAGRFVSDDSLNRAISAIRRLSKLSGPTGFRIETIAKVGYRLATDKAESNGSPEVVLAVLPFEFTPTNPGSSWLSDGIAEAILNTVAASTSIRVIGRSSSFQFRGANKAVGIVKSALRVTHVLDGVVQQDGDTIRVSVQLVEADKETIIWSEWIEEPNDGAPGLGSRVAERVAKALDRAFAERRRPLRVDARAYELYLRGAELTRNIDPVSQSTAVSLLEECVRLAPELADGWGALALGRVQLGFFGEPSAESRGQAIREARRALQIDPGCASARLVPYVGGPVFDFSEHRIYETPAPSSHGRTASPDVSFGVQMLEQGRISDALAFFALAERYDPLFQIRIFYHSLALLCDGSIGDGLARLEDAAARWPDLPFFLAARLRWGAAAGDWPTVENYLIDGENFERALRHRAADVRAWIEFSRNPAPAFAEFLTLRNAAISAHRSGLEELLLYAKIVGIEEVLERLQLAGEIIVNVEAGRRPDEIGAIALWLPIYDAVRQSAAFATLTSRILPVLN